MVSQIPASHADITFANNSGKSARFADAIVLSYIILVCLIYFGGGWRPREEKFSSLSLPRRGAWSEIKFANALEGASYFIAFF